jgi:hypothetical protein
VKLNFIWQVCRGFFALLFITFLHGCNTVKPIQEPYAGLLPVTFKPQTLTSIPSVATFKNSKLAIVPSANYEAMVLEWVGRYEGNGRKASENQLKTADSVAKLISPIHLLFGDKADVKGSLDETQKLTDPRRLLKESMPFLISRFNQVEVFADIATAREKGADYIIVMDYYGSFNEMGDRYASRVGFHALDKSLQQLFQIERSGSTKRLDPSKFLATSSDFELAVAQTIVNAMNGIIPSARSELMQKLSSQN